MKFTTLLTGLAAFTAMGIVGTANAIDRTFDGGPGGTGTDWNTAANWSSDNVPNALNEKAIIPNGFTVNLDTSPTIGSLEMGETAILNIAPNASATLTIDADTLDGLVVLKATSDSVYAVINVGDGDSDHTGVLRLQDNTAAHQVGGDIILWESDSVLDVEVDNAIFGPYSTFFGSVVGKDNAAKVEINSGLTLTNRIIFEGMMQIAPAAGWSVRPTFMNDRESTSVNSGLCWANLAGTFALHADLILDDDTFSSGGTTYYPVWKSSVNTSAKLQFNREADGSPDVSLVGNFVLVDCADMDFTQSVTTSGTFTDGSGGSPAGNLTVTTGKTFTFSGGSYSAGTHNLGGC
jgi:hypothetical protein